MSAKLSENLRPQICSKPKDNDSNERPDSQNSSDLSPGLATLVLIGFTAFCILTLWALNRALSEDSRWFLVVIAGIMVFFLVILVVVVFSALQPQKLQNPLPIINDFLGNALSLLQDKLSFGQNSPIDPVTGNWSEPPLSPKNHPLRPVKPLIPSKPVQAAPQTTAGQPREKITAGRGTPPPEKSSGENTPHTPAPPTLTMSNSESLKYLEFARKIVRHQVFIALAILAITLLCAWLISPLFLMGLLLFAAYGVYIYRSSEFSVLFQEQFVQRKLGRVFQDFYYEPYRGVQAARIHQSQLVDLEDTLESKNYISGQYKGVRFEQADVYIASETPQNAPPLFEGRWMVLQLPRPLHAGIYILHHKFPGCATFQNTKKNLHALETEDKVFNRSYKVFSPNPQSALHPLSPQFHSNLEKILQQTNFSGNLQITAVKIENNDVQIAVHGAPATFSNDLYNPVNRREVQWQAETQIHLITNIIDEFCYLMLAQSHPDQLSAGMMKYLYMENYY